mgnify:CR=1 FL=1
MERKAKDGSVSYERGVIELVVVRSNTTFDEFVFDVCDALGINRTGKTFHYINKNDVMRLIRLHDSRGLALMFRFSNDTVDIYVNDVSVDTPARVLSTR